MNGRAVLFVLGNLLLVLGGCFVAPFIVALLYASRGPTNVSEAAVFAGMIGAMAVIGFSVRYAFRDAADAVRAREGFAIVTFSWVLMVAVGMMPYLVLDATGSVADAFFETMSGFTTTGATIFPAVETLPPALQFWRCMTQWLGGMGVVVLSVALLPILGIGGYRLLKAETPGGVTFERERPRITDTAKDLWRLYLGLSLALTLLLRMGGMTWFDALCHMFTTMSTGGFSPHSASVGYFPSPWIQWTIIVFMLLAGMNFSVHAQALRGRWWAVARDAELRGYAAVVVACVLLGFFVVPRVAGVEEHLRDVAFAVVSIITTTGFATADFDLWPDVMRFVLVMLMFVGGSMGSTAGGLKVTRVLVYGKAIVGELQRMVRPHAILPLRIGTRVIERSIVTNILTFGCIYSALFVLGTLVLAACQYDLVTATSAAAAALGNVGPGLAKVGPTQTWAHLPDVAKWTMSALMLFGRLELYSVLVVLSPWAWRR